MREETGFTFIELLAVMVLLMTVGGIVGSIFFSTLRGTNKANTLTDVRQNGNFAVTQISNLLRDAVVFDGISTDGITYRENCLMSQIQPTPPPINFHYIKITGSDRGQTILACDAPAGKIASNDASLVDGSTVAIDSCSFLCFQQYVSEKPLIQINVSLSQYTPPGFKIVPERKATVPFQTSVLLRSLH